MADDDRSRLEEATQAWDEPVVDPEVFEQFAWERAGEFVRLLAGQPASEFPRMRASLAAAWADGFKSGARFKKES